MAVSILNLMADPMHIIDLGVAHHIVGNVLWMMCYFPRFFPAGNNAPERCDMLWRRAGKYKNICKNTCKNLFSDLQPTGREPVPSSEHRQPALQSALKLLLRPPGAAAEFPRADEPRQGGGNKATLQIVCVD